MSMSTADPEKHRLIGSLALARSWPVRYGLALLAVAAATGLRYAVGVAFGLTLPFIFFYPAILLAALLGGFAPGMFATFLSLASGLFFFHAQMNVIAGSQARQVVWLILFFLSGAVLSLMSEWTRQYQARLLEFERLVEGLEEGVFVLDRNYRYLIVNRAFQGYKGLNREQILGRSITDFMDAELFARNVRPRLEECFQGKVVKFEKKFKYPEIGERDFSVTYVPITGKTGVERVGCILQDVTQKKQSDHALRLFRTLIDLSSDAVEVVDPRTLRYYDVNERACKDLGYTREELLAMTVFDIDPGINEARRAHAWEKLKSSGHFVMQGVHRRKDGSLFPVEATLQYARLDRDYVVTVVRDVTDRKRTEAALRDSEDRYRDLVEHSEDLVCTHDLEGNLVSVNPAPARVLGYEVEELLKIPMREFVAPEFRQQFEAYLERMKNKGTDRGLLCVLTRSGERRIWEYNNTLRTEGVSAPVVRAMARDITEKKRTEAALRGSEERYRTLFEKAVAGVAIISLEGELTDCNDAWARMFGYDSASECRGITVTQHYFDRTAREELLQELLQKGAVTNRELKVRRRNGEPLWLLVNDILMRDSQNRQSIQATVFDITARKLAEAALRQSEERFRVALKDSPITVFSQDRELRYTWIYNPRLYWQPENIGKTDQEIMGEEAAETLGHLKRRVLEKGETLREEVVIPHEGKNYAFDMTIEPLFDADKKIAGITGASVDVARLREQADSLQDAKDRLVREKSYLEKQIETELGFEQIIGQSPALRDVLKTARVVAPTDSTVLLLGETGTGKELVARSVHALSARGGAELYQDELRGGPFGASGERTVRAREGSVYRRSEPENRASRAGGSGHAVSG